MTQTTLENLRALSRRLGAAALGALVAGISLYGCDDLPRLEVNVCGNRVIEEDFDEDCDGQENCGRQGSQHACRYLCGAEQNHECPDGYHCGVDEVCRRPKGVFEPLSTKTVATGLGMFVGDVNADGCSEVVASTFNGTLVTSFESRQPGLCAAGEQLFAGRPPEPSKPFYPSPFVADLNGNARPELVIAADGVKSGALRVYSSDVSTQLAALVIPTDPIAEPGVRLVKVTARGVDRLLMFLGEAYQPPAEEMPTCGPEVDGGTMDPDGGTMMMPDGGMMPPPDGGMMPPPDGGMMPPPDGGMMPPPDGGMPPPPDGGMPPPPDGGMPPPPDGGPPPPPPDGGPPPPPPIPPPREAKTVRVAGLEFPGAPPHTIIDAMPGGGLNDIVATAVADLDGDGCSEVAIAYAHSDLIHLYTVCGAGDALVFDEYAKCPTVKLDGTAQMRSRNASIAFGDVNGDQILDIVTNGNDCKAHVAFGTPGHEFTSGATNGVADHQTTEMVIPSHEDQEAVADPNSVLFVGRFDIKAPGAVVGARRCPPGDEFKSDVCAPIPGDCEALVADIDRDSYDDVVSTQGQQLGILVSRSYGTSPGFHRSYIDTDCPPHNLTIGDFDDDGVNDVAFLDQAAVAGGTPRRVLKIAYGRAYAAPAAPRLAGIIDGATALASGSFDVGGPPGPGQIYAARAFGKDADGGPISSGVGLVSANDSAEMLAPIYIPERGANDKGLEALLDMDILGVTPGMFAGSDAKPIAGLAVVARPPASDAKPELWLVHQDPIDDHTVAVRASGVNDLVCESCVLAAANTDDAGRDELLVFDDKTLLVYGAGDGGFTEKRRATLDHAVAAADAALNPRRYEARPLVAYLDDDDSEKKHVDVVLRATTGELVVLWGKGDGAFEEAVLFPAPPCDESHCAGQAVALVSVDDTVKKKLVRVGPGILEFHELKQRVPERIDVDVPLSAPAKTTDYVAVGAADLDGDGVDDLAIMTSGSSLHILRGIPVHE